MHRGWEISGYHDVQDIGSSRGVVWVSGWGVRPKDKTGVRIGIVTQEFPPPRAQPGIPVDMLGVQVMWTWKVASFYPELSWSACSAVG